MTLLIWDRKTQSGATPKKAAGPGLSKDRLIFPQPAWHLFLKQNKCPRPCPYVTSLSGLSSLLPAQCDTPQRVAMRTASAMLCVTPELPHLQPFTHQSKTLIKQQGCAWLYMLCTTCNDNVYVWGSVPSSSVQWEICLGFLLWKHCGITQAGKDMKKLLCAQNNHSCCK